MTTAKPAPDAPEASASQFSKFSINQDRPTKRRRNVTRTDSESSPNPANLSSSVTDAAPSNQDRDAAKSKDSSVQPATRSCAECRRMKLKCDRIFPCKTCVRRGLEGICPEGSLVTGRGTRYVLASTQELHEKILKMADRIKTLEDALGALHQEHSKCRPCTCQPIQGMAEPAESHPLLRGELLLVKGQLELYGLGMSKEQGNLPPEQSTHLDVSQSPQASGRIASSGTEIHRDKESPASVDSKRKHRVAPTEEGKRPRQIEESPIERGKRLRAMLPPREEAERLARETIWHGAWILNITSRPGRRAKLLYDLYYGPLEDIRAQDIALTLMALALGERVDIGPATSKDHRTPTGLYSPDSSSNSGDESGATVSDAKRVSCEGKKPNLRNVKTTEREKPRRKAQESYNLAKAALNEVPAQGEPDQTVVHCLFVMAWYLSALADSKDAGREAMAAVTLAVKIAFKLGMHLEETYNGLSSEVQQERRILFWALLHLEAKLHLDTSTVGALGTKKITTKRPFATVPGAIKSFSTLVEAIYHDFKLAFLEACMVPTLRIVEKAPKMRVKEKDYYDVLDLDAQIRDFQLPPVLAEHVSVPAPPETREFLHASSHADLNFILNPSTNVPQFNLSYEDGQTPRSVLRMIRAKAQQEKLITLLYLHRTFFYAHIRDHRPLVQRMFLPSCLSAFSAACQLITSVREIYAVEPELAARVSMFWYNGFLATITLFLLVIYKPFCPVTSIALREIERSRNLFQSASAKCHIAAQSYPLLRELFAKANEVYNRWKEESEGELNVFGPNGEVTFCQTRLDIVIQRLQSVSVPSDAEEEATAGLLNLKRCTNSPSTSQASPCEKAPQPPCSGARTDEGSSYEMWQHVHKEMTDFVRRIPKVLKDAALDPRRATAARLIWGFIPVPEEPKSDGMLMFDEPDMSGTLPSDLDWNAFADALMFAPMTRPDHLRGHSTDLGLPTPPATTYSPESSQSNYSLFEFCPDLDFMDAGGTGLTPDIAMENVWNVSGQDDVLFGLAKDVPLAVLRNDPMLGAGGAGGEEYEYLGHKDDGTTQNSASSVHHVGGSARDDFLSPSVTVLDDGTLGYLWQHRMQSPYLS